MNTTANSFQNVNWLLMLGNFLASGTGALIAGYLGVYFGRKKLRDERAFDRRLSWYETALSKAHQVSIFFGRFQSFVMYGFPEIRPEELDRETRERLFEIVELATGAEMYALPETAEAAIRLRRYSVSEFAVGLEEMSVEARNEKLAQMTGELLHLLDIFRDTLVMDCRTHLKLEDLPKALQGVSQESKLVVFDGKATK